MYNNDNVIPYPNIPTMENWESNTIQAARELAGNPRDPRRTRSQFESALSIKDPFFAEKCYLVESNPKKYEEAS